MAFPEGLTSPEMEISEGGVILDNRTRFADLKTMLDSSKDNLKVDAMKRIINLIAKGKDVSELFPAVVKNVAAKNVELKKLVYVYLVRYAEEQQDLALLSISTFQRALKDPNQLIRASALRVLSSIRVGMIAPIMLLAIKDSVRDMSPYVRKVAAHAIPKLYSLDPELETELVDCIDFLLADRRSLVLGSAVYAFEEICPNRLDLLHKHFRALCRALADVDEWGQVMMINLLTRYARSELADPELLPQPDVDLTLLLNSARPLLQSRNCSVVMAVTQLFYYTAPKAQLSQVARALVRLLRGPREVQYVVLLNIATICERNPVLPGTYAISKNMFDPFLKSFFVRSSDPSFVKELKLHILTSLVSEANVHVILRELQTYVSSSDLAGAAIEAIGRCAVRVKAVSEQCLAGLVPTDRFS
ncbi:adaptin region [Ostertagia ostertagi]